MPLFQSFKKFPKFLCILLVVSCFLFFQIASALAVNPIPAGNYEAAFGIQTISDLSQWNWQVQLGTNTQNTQGNGISTLNNPSSPLPWSYYQNNTACPNQITSSGYNNGNPYYPYEGRSTVNLVSGGMMELKTVGADGSDPGVSPHDSVSEYSIYGTRNLPSVPSNYGWRLGIYNVTFPSFGQYSNGINLYYSGSNKLMASIQGDNTPISSGGSHGILVTLYDLSGAPNSTFRFDINNGPTIYNGINGAHHFAFVGGNNSTLIQFYYQRNSANDWVNPISYNTGSFQTPGRLTIGNQIALNGCGSWSTLDVGTIAIAAFQPGSQISTLSANSGVTYPTTDATYPPNTPTKIIYGNTSSFNIAGFGSANNVNLNLYGAQNDIFMICNTSNGTFPCPEQLIASAPTNPNYYVSQVPFNSNMTAQPGLNFLYLSGQDVDGNRQDKTSFSWTQGEYCYDNLGPNAPTVTGTSGSGFVQFFPNIPSDLTSGSTINGFNYSCSSGTSSTYTWQASTASNFASICANGTGSGNNSVILNSSSGANCGINNLSSQTVYLRLRYSDNVGNNGSFGQSSATSQPTTGTPPAPTLTNTIPNPNQCLFSPDLSTSNDLLIQWTDNSKPATKVLISTSGSFSSYYAKAVTGSANTSNSTYAPNGFTGAVGVSGPLTLAPGTIYYIRLYNPNLGPVSSITVPQCSSPQVSCTNPSYGITNQSYPWTASPSGGDGDYSSWSWSWKNGSGNTICASQECDQTYGFAGPQSLTVTASDTGNTASQTCNTQIYSPFTVSCNMTTNPANVNAPVTWGASTTGGDVNNGGNVTYLWSDSVGHPTPTPTPAPGPYASWTLTYNQVGSVSASIKAFDNSLNPVISASNNCPANIVQPSFVKIQNGDIHSNQ